MTVCVKRSQNLNSRDIVCHTITKEYQHLEFRSRTFCVDSHQVKEHFEATARTKTVEEQPQVVQNLVLITQACSGSKNII